MISWFISNLGTIAVGLVLLAVIVAVILYLRAQKKKGRGSCSCSCESCGACPHSCGANTEK